MSKIAWAKVITVREIKFKLVADSSDGEEMNNY